MLYNILFQNIYNFCPPLTILILSFIHIQNAVTILISHNSDTAFPWLKKNLTNIRNCILPLTHKHYNKHLLRSNTENCGCNTRYAYLQDSDTMAHSSGGGDCANCSKLRNFHVHLCIIQLLLQLKVIQHLQVIIRVPWNSFSLDPLDERESSWALLLYDPP
jgi:hypothetical protein